jgi:hypothetical protein
MSSETGSGETAVLPPDDAFALLGHETRIRIIEVLGEVGEPMAFSDIYDEVDLHDTAQFNYHLDRLVGHFVTKTDDGYELQRAGERVVEAILSGAITDDPVLDRTEIDASCPYCGATIEVEYDQEWVSSYCTECEGTYSGADVEEGSQTVEYGYLGRRPLPPAGVRSRSAMEVRQAAHTWNMSERMPAASGVCPRCSARLSESIDVCEDHEASDGLCAACGNRHAVSHAARCTNCIFSQGGAFVLALLSDTDLISFLTEHGINPIAPPEADPGIFANAVMDYEEDVLETEPFRARFTFVIEGETLELTVDDSFEVVETSR